MPYFDAVVFDIDGTLVTCGDYMYAVTEKILCEMDKRATRDEIRRFWHGPCRNRTIRECFGADPDEFWKIFRKHDTYESRAENTRPFHDAGIVREISYGKIKTGAVTGAVDYVVRANLSLLPEGIFDKVVVAQPSSGMQKKPSPEALLRCLDDLGVPPGRSLYVGNSDEDILMARSAGVPVALLPREGEILEHEPTWLLDSTLHELRGLAGI